MSLVYEVKEKNKIHEIQFVFQVGRYVQGDLKESNHTQWKMAPNIIMES